MDSSPPRRFYFNTDALPERDRFPAFCEGIFRHVVGADIGQLGSERFGGSLDIRSAGAVGIADICISTAQIMRQAKHISDGNDAIVVQFWRQGRGCMTQGKHESRVGSGEGLTIDNAKPASMYAEGICRFWSLNIPRNKFSALNPRATAGVGAKLADTGALRLLSAYLGEMDAACFTKAASARIFGNHVVDLAALALGGDLGVLAEAEGVRAARRSTILGEIARRSSDPNLSATVLAPLLGVTPRYVHLLLEATGKSFTHHVLERRLEKAAALLRDPQWRHRKIADIAAEAGFADLSHFNRSFRRHFGATPSDIREGATRAG
jgi:AraC-like DNA-binding protein